VAGLVWFHKPENDTRMGDEAFRFSYINVTKAVAGINRPNHTPAGRVPETYV
jgi:hypothetical protein